MTAQSRRARLTQQVGRDIAWLGGRELLGRRLFGGSGQRTLLSLASTRSSTCHIGRGGGGGGGSVSAE
eukprot:7383522-Prymnesium_polylepis.1